MMFYNSIVIIFIYTLIILRIKKQLYLLNLFHFEMAYFKKIIALKVVKFKRVLIFVLVKPAIEKTQVL